MTRRRSSRPLSVESLDGRQLCSANVVVGMFDANLTAAVQPVPNQTTQTQQVVVDGSDYDDTVRVLAVNPFAGVVSLRLQQRTGGVLVSDKTVTLHAPKLDPFVPVAIYAKKGNDQVFNVTLSPVFVDAGDGNDYLSGGSGNDNLYGGPGNDTIMGRGGKDFLSGDTGNDYVRGGLGNDFLFGQEGDDILYGEGGNDYLDGGAGNDQIYGDVEDPAGGGRDSLFGSAGDDSLFGGGASDSLYGGAGNDRLDAGNGNDYLQGDDGNDALYAGAGNDHAYGNLGADSLYGGAGNDYLDGGTDDPDFSGDLLEGDAGADTFVHHHHILGVDDADSFIDFSPAQGDTEDDQWHLF